MLERVSAPKNAHVWERGDLDWYVEPIRATEALLTVERFVGSVCDPACGSGNIIRAFSAAGYAAYGTDVVDRGAPNYRGIRDFLSGEVGEGERPVNIVCNPPFFRAKGTESFARRALALASAKVCVFASIKFLAGQARGAGLWRDHPPHRVWILCERPSCPPGEWLAAGNAAKGGTDDWIWLVWDLTSPSGETRLGWLRGRKDASIGRRMMAPPPDTRMIGDPLVSRLSRAEHLSPLEVE